MEADYRHTQVGMLMLVVFLAAGVLIGLVAPGVIAQGRWGSAAAMIGLYGVGVATFHSLTIEISGRKLTLHFGIGILRKTYRIEEIQSARQVVNPWYYGWGIKSIPGGWFYAIAPGEAVELVLKNGKIVQLGTNQPKVLKQAIDNAIQSIREK